MISEAKIEQAIQSLFDGIEFIAKPEGLYDPLRYMIGLGGKRVRPRLCLTVYSLYKDAFGDGVLDAAAALEVFHSFTLIHDDIMDKAPIRRGKTTVWKKWDANTAVLSGDVMNIDSYKRLAKVNAGRLPEAMQLFNDMAAAVCEGQQYDMEFESRPKVEMSEYIQMIGLKTSHLIACAAKMGAVLAGVSQSEKEAFFSYGFDLGLAFQIADDYLDTFGDKETFGKTIGGDILNNKKTWLLTRAMEMDADSVKSAISLPSGTAEQDSVKIRTVSDLYGKLGVDVAAKSEISRYTQQAMGHLDKIGLSRVKLEMMSRYADRLVGRTK